ncbi:alpha/beta hydrolase [Neobacillus niacini]|uniref:alpha/beta fold hydrolase n=1 Tax=Neobacillus niacini TaxID=86668 RepID=UPI00052F71CC|nr:alpha/beta hydrolase [Neobacillus niacini]KGM46293.1 peptidase [Neobacillus niacini]MEC1524417.1 alpha/beta hydrolase [Neobacillus niacini]
MRDLMVPLKDGRRLAVIEYGDPKGLPVMFFHGTPGSRLLFLEDDGISKTVGIRLISLDRPGFGLSDPKPNRTLLDWADDINEAADFLKLDKFSIIGVSGGGAFAASCAYKLSERLQSVSLVASTTPFVNGKSPKGTMTANKIAFFLARKAPWLVKASYRITKRLLEEQPEKFMKQNKKGNKHLHEWDRQFLQTDEQLKGLMLHLGEAFRISVDECVNEPVLLTKPWGFSFKDITVPIDVWHGVEDRMAPAAEMRKIASAIPICYTHFIAEAGHFLTDDEQIWKDILTTILERAKENPSISLSLVK